MQKEYTWETKTKKESCLLSKSVEHQLLKFRMIKLLKRETNTNKKLINSMFLLTTLSQSSYLQCQGLWMHLTLECKRLAEPRKNSKERITINSQLRKEVSSELLTDILTMIPFKLLRMKYIHQLKVQGLLLLQIMTTNTKRKHLLLISMAGSKSILTLTRESLNFQKMLKRLSQDMI